MKPLMPALLLFFFFHSTSKDLSSVKNWSSIKAIGDSTPIAHKLDGLVEEWPIAKFSSDPETGIQYAIDNDGENLYLAMNVTGSANQMHLVRRGMNLFIDMKGKKKEGRGIEFPLKTESSDISDAGSFQDNGRPSPDGNNVTDPNNHQRNADIKKLRIMMAINLVYLKFFGFRDGEPVVQDLKVPGSISIAFNWDSSNVMHIEYLIPLKMLGDNNSLDQKNLSIGWKINALERQSGNSENGDMTGSGSNEGGYRGGRSGGRGYGGGGHSNHGGQWSQADREKMMKAQSFWTSYTIVLPR